MHVIKTLTSALAAAGLVGAIGLAYAQTAQYPATPAATPAATTTPEAMTAPAPSSTTTSDPMAAPLATTPSPAVAPSDSTSLPPQQDRN